MKNQAKVLALANQKGGVGKSVSAANLACSFALRGKKTLLLDADFQGNASSQIGIKDIAIDKNKTLTAGLMENVPAESIVLKTNFDNLFAISPDMEFDEFNHLYLGKPGNHLLLRKWLAPVREQFDIIVIDTHPSLELTFQNVMVASDYYALPLFAESDSVEGLHIMFKHLGIIQAELNPSLSILGCFVTRYDSKNVTHKRFLAYLEAFGPKHNLPVLGVMPMSNAMASSTAMRIPVVNWKPELPVSKSYEKLADDLLAKMSLRKKGRTPKTPNITKKSTQIFKQAVKIDNTDDFTIEEQFEI